ncbi:chymotrypsin family serine protease [Mycobacterium sp. MUNTM1]
MSLQGGVPVYVGAGPNPVRCTAGFPLVAMGGIRYYLIAGHCAQGIKDAPVFVDTLKLVDGKLPMQKFRVQIGTITQNQYPTAYRFDAADPNPFPDIAVFTNGTKTWPAPATPSVGGDAVIRAAEYPPDRLANRQNQGESVCWSAANGIGYDTACGQIQWVKDNYVAIKSDKPDWAAQVGDGFPGTPVWATDSASGITGTVGILSYKLADGTYVADVTADFIRGRFVEDSALGAKMPDGYVPNPPLFSAPK